MSSCGGWSFWTTTVIVTLAVVVKTTTSSTQSYENTLTLAQYLSFDSDDGRLSGPLTLEYTIDHGDDSGDDDDRGEVFYGRFIFAHGDRKEGGWIGLGFAASLEEPKMKGSKAVIGVPDGGDDAPRLWNLGDYSVERVTPLSTRLILPRLRQNSTHTELEFGIAAQDLHARKEIPTTLLWAVGASNVLAHHGNRQVLDLTAPPNNDGSERDIAAWRLHGWLAFIAWGVLLPLGITASLLRDALPSSSSRFSWLSLHMTLNVSAIGVSYLVILIAVILTARHNGSHFSGGHPRMGVAMTLVGTLQLVGGYWRPPENANLSRTLWEVGHRGIALFLLLASLFQILSGLEQFHDRFQKGKHRQGRFWTYVITVASVVAVLRLLLWLQSRQTQKQMDTGPAGTTTTTTTSAAAATQELASMGSPEEEGGAAAAAAEEEEEEVGTAASGAENQEFPELT